jgi:aminoglycoside/choline kinase family phosphotransferase
MEIEGDQSIILMHYTADRPENALYAEIAELLHQAGVPAPGIIMHSKEYRILCMEDLGECDLYDFRNHDWSVRKEYYQQTLHHARTLHDQALKVWEQKPFELMHGFDDALYQWEQDYFEKQCAERLFEHTLNDSIRSELKALKNRMLEHPTALVHRDFQSQNIMVFNEKVYFIDFQGLRKGSPFYDLASLLYDPYVPFTESQRQELVSFYISCCEYNGFYDEKNARHLLQDAAVQRLLQALGAYGFLSQEKGKIKFLDYVEPALRNLMLVSQSNLPSLHKFTHSLLDLWNDKKLTVSLRHS